MVRRFAFFGGCSYCFRTSAMMSGGSAASTDASISSMRTPGYAASNKVLPPSLLSSRSRLRGMTRFDEVDNDNSGLVDDA